MRLYPSILSVNRAVSDARKAAHETARAACPGGFLQSRGAWYVATRTTGDNKISSGESQHDKKFSTYERTLADCEADPLCDVLYIEGGYDASERIDGFRDGDYEPWVSEWTLEVWRR